MQLKHCTWILCHRNPYGSTPPLIADVQDCNAQVVTSSYAALGDNAIRVTCEALPYSFYSNPTDHIGCQFCGIRTSMYYHLISNIWCSCVASHKTLEKYGVKENILVVNKTAVNHHVGDPWQSMRCAFWAQVPYLEVLCVMLCT